MPSTIVGNVSGGALLVSGDIYSGYQAIVGGIQFKVATDSPGVIYLGLPNLSGNYPSVISGGALASGLSGYYLTDGMPMAANDAYFVPKARLVSGVLTPRFVMPATSSGARVFWEPL